MKKRTLFLFALAALMLCSLFGFSVFAAETTLDGVSYQYDMVDGGVRILSYTPNGDEWVVPAEIDGTPVKTVAILMPQTRRLVLPATVEAITDNVRTNASFLREIVVAEDNPALCAEDGMLLSKDKARLLLYAKSCGAASCAIPAGVTAIPGNLFSGCQSVTEITVPASVAEIGGNAFANCTALCSVTFAGAPTKIGKDAFSGCTALQQVHLGDPVHWCETVFGNRQASPMHLKPQVLSGGSPLTELKITEPITQVTAYAFENCESLTALALPDSVKTIGAYAFFSCRALRELTMPRYLESVGDYAFSGCTNLESFLLPVSVKTLGKNVLTSGAKLKTFADCSGLFEMLGFELLLSPGCHVYARTGAFEPDDYLKRGISVTELNPADCEKGAHCLSYYPPTVVRKATCNAAGEETVECLICNKIMTREIPVAQHVFEETVRPADLKSDGELTTRCKNCDYQSVDVIPQVKTIKQLVTTNQYTGKPTAVRLLVKRSDGYQLDEGEDYTIAYQNNTEVGTATATVTLKGLYTGSRRFTYQIVPAKTAVVKQKKATASAVTIAWRKVTGAQSYRVYCYDSSQKRYVQAAETTKNKAVLKKLESGTTYRLRVYAVRKGVEGLSSSVLRAVTAPKAPTVKLQKLSNGTLRIRWSRPTGADGYVLLIGVDPKLEEEVIVIGIADKKTKRFDIPDLPRGETYYVRVLAYRNGDDGEALSNLSKTAKLKLS